MREFKIDVLVIGGGPAGSSAARVAAEQGAGVLLVERRSDAGEPVQCGEWVPQLIRAHVVLPDEVIAVAVSRLHSRYWRGRSRDALIGPWEDEKMSAPGFMIRRGAFDRHLLDAARSAGAEVWLGTTARGRSADAVTVSRGGEEIAVRAGAVVGADGAHSPAGRWIDVRNRHLLRAAGYEYPADERGRLCTDAVVYLHPLFAGGYGWFFPRGETANVGIGVNPALAAPGRMVPLLKRFVGMLAGAGFIRGGPLRATGGLIPAGGMLPVVARGGILLAGDAAGLAHPITGAGIMNAVISGALAGEHAARYAGGDEVAPLDYGRKLRSLLGENLAWGARRREEHDSLWPWPDFITSVRRAWVTSPSYWTGRHEADNSSDREESA